MESLRVSVLIPSRGRPEKLAEAIGSIYATVEQPDSMEIIVRLDTDDSRLARALNSVRIDHPEVRFLVGPRGRGYLDMNNFWNELARCARGDWLATFNDDARHEVPGWDLHLDLHTEGVVMPKDDSTGYGWPAFPIIHRSIYDKWGYLTQFPGVDTWIKAAFIDKGGPAHRAGDAIRIRHERPNKEQYAHLHDQTWAESDPAEQQLCLEWNDPSWGQRANDAWLALGL